ncbi:MAG: maleylpyruvate isomerase family mycothiol-dependent enzyme [Dermatophilaceae bacterium]
MPTTLDFAEHGEGIGDAATVLRNNAVAAGLGAPVPSCPGWTVLDLLAHQGMVHRWATDVVQGVPREQWRSDVELERHGRAAPDILDWFDEGLVELLNALARAPRDLDAYFFLKDAPPPREAWARRQCHETSIHAVDAMAARLRRMPLASETWVRPALAADGIDELLCGFLPRRSGRLRSDRPLTVHVRPSDVEQSWTMRIGPDPVVTGLGRQGLGQHGIPDVTLEATAAQLYLGLWNRGEEIAGDGAHDFLARWRSGQRVTWS